MTPLILLTIGFLLIFIEFYIPGAVIGITGGIMVFISLILFAMESQSLLLTTLLVIAVIVGLVGLVKFALFRIKNAKPNKSIYSADNQVGFQACSYDAAQIGKTGIAETDLKPSGHILIEGKSFQAISQNNYLVKGSEVVVIGGQEGSLIVTKKVNSQKIMADL